MTRSFTRFVAAVALVVMCFGGPSQGQDQMQIEDFDTIQLYTLENTSGAKVKITNYGAIVTSIVVPDRDGNLADVALGYESVEEYINAVDKPYFGAVVGRYGNRIAKGQFQLGGETYSLATNNGPNHLHGGVIGFDKVVWEATPTVVDGHPALKLAYLAKDGEEGYPGNLNVVVTYQWTDANELIVRYEATTDKATPINLTQHTYFNLAGEGSGDILNHQLMLNASKFTPVDETLIPTGELRPVEGTPFDFRSAKAIGKDIAVENEQLKFGLGYDHNFVLDQPEENEMVVAAQVFEPTTGRTLEIRTTEPGIQFYCGNFLDGRLRGKSGRPYSHRSGFCLETQHFPDSPNQPEFPTAILNAGDKYDTTTVFQFGSK